jgi:translation initiation factor 5
MITTERHERALLGGTERFVGKDQPELIPSIPTILMGFYENDLASEETITKWGSKASKKYVDIKTSKQVRKAAEPFLKWLETADESSSEDEDEEEEDDE